MNSEGNPVCDLIGRILRLPPPVTIIKTDRNRFMLCASRSAIWVSDLSPSFINPSVFQVIYAALTSFSFLCSRSSSIGTRQAGSLRYKIFRIAGVPPAQENGAYIPYSYVDDENLRVKLYGRISSLAKETEVQQLRREFADRFGKLPPAMRNLFEIARIRIAAAYAGIKTVRVNEERIMLIRNDEPIMMNGRYPRLTPDTTSRRLKEILELVKQSKP